MVIKLKQWIDTTKQTLHHSITVEKQNVGIVKGTVLLLSWPCKGLNSVTVHAIVVSIL